MASTTSVYVDPKTGGVQAGLMQFRNAIINGDMRINQRGTSTILASLTAVGATHGWVSDRWNVYRNGFVTGIVMGQGTDLSLNDLPFQEAGITTFNRVGRLSGNTATDLIYSSYNIESQDSIKYKGKQVTFSFYARAGVNFSGSVLYGELITGAGTDQALRSGYTSGTVEGSVTPILNSTWRRYTLTRTISQFSTQCGVRFAYLPTGTALAADYFDITGVQLELGSVATPFEMRPYPVELQLCQRYYEKSYSINTAPGTNTNSGLIVFHGTIDRYGNALYNYRFIICKRTAPSMTFYTYSGTLNQWSYDSDGNAGSNTITNIFLNELGGNLYVFISYALAFKAMTMSGYWVANAEL